MIPNALYPCLLSLTIKISLLYLFVIFFCKCTMSQKMLKVEYVRVRSCDVKRLPPKNSKIYF